MPFWLHEPRSIVAAKSLPATTKVGTLAAVCLVGVAWWFAILFKPLITDYLKAYSNTQALHENQQLLQTEANRRDALQAENKLLKERVAEFSLTVGPLQQTVADIIHALREHNLSCRGIQPLTTTSLEFHERHLMQITSKGEFHEIIRFLEEIEDPSYPVTVQSMRLKREEGKGLLLEVVVWIISFKEG